MLFWEKVNLKSQQKEQFVEEGCIIHVHLYNFKPHYSIVFHQHHIDNADKHLLARTGWEFVSHYLHTAMGQGIRKSHVVTCSSYLVPDLFTYKSSLIIVPEQRRPGMRLSRTIRLSRFVFGAERDLQFWSAVRASGI